MARAPNVRSHEISGIWDQQAWWFDTTLKFGMCLCRTAGQWSWQCLDACLMPHHNQSWLIINYTPKNESMGNLNQNSYKFPVKKMYLKILSKKCDDFDNPCSIQCVKVFLNKAHRAFPAGIWVLCQPEPNKCSVSSLMSEVMEGQCG